MDLLHADAQGRNMTYQELTVLSNIKNRLYCKTAGCGQIYCSHKD